MAAGPCCRNGLSRVLKLANNYRAFYEDDQQFLDYSMVIAIFLHQNTIMQFKFTKNIQFTKLIKANGRLKEFNFRKLNDHKEGMFTVDVVDERDSRVFFSIQKIDNTWKIIQQPLPQWILENEQIFHDVIEEELKLT